MIATPRLTSLCVLGLLLLATPAAASLSDAERRDIEARIHSLEGELDSLRQRLVEAPAEEAAPDQGEAPGEAVLSEIRQRRALERESTRNPLAITAYRRNYLLPVSFNNRPNRDAFRAITEANGPSDTEVKFQFSVKVNLIEDLVGNNGDLFFAFTQRSWWQAYNTEASSPFRETNYEPELFLSFDNAWTLLGWTNTRNRLGFSHQSNGRSNPVSRSWNRLYADLLFQHGDWAVSLTPHWRIPESAGDDDNPDLERYLGYGDIGIARRFAGDHEASLLVRGNPGAGHLGTQLDYSWPLFGRIRGHLQYYQGYGESLIDYDHRVQRVSLGFSINPLFSTHPE
ncbi:phospholipase [Bisbaumannia pacifica]|uniref:Phospholipase A1 n=1 Tax=Bisbaumannia pacifica TaxID=77098 RepID=A0A510XA56_9GAMM|nr:phospholipase A [Halomonas pacifica]GEK48312.1 phospholipase [Halomonas pacifica]